MSTGRERDHGSTSDRYRGAAGAGCGGTRGARRGDRKVRRCDRRTRPCAVPNGSPSTSVAPAATRAVRSPFGEALPEQLQLAMEDIEQAIASDEAAQDRKNEAGARQSAERRRASRGALPAHLPHIDVTIAPEVTCCPCCRAPLHVIGEETSRRLERRPGAVPRDRHPSSQICLPGLHGWRGSSAGTGAADQGRLADRGDGRPCAGRQICLAPATVSAGSDAAGAGYRHQALGSGVLGRLCGRGASSALAQAARDHSDREQDRCRRDHGAGARSWPRPHQEGLLLGNFTRRSPWGGADPPAVAYTHAPGRGAVHALKLLDGYRGIMQCDGYTVYKTIADTAPDAAITLAFCWAHLRDGASSTLSRTVLPRSRAKRSSASPLSMPSRRRPGAAAPMSAVPSARSAASRR